MSLALVVQLAASSPQGTASIEGVVVKLGTTDAVVDADVELSRVEGVAEAPMTDAATAFFKTVLDGFGPSGAFPPAVIANEVQYAEIRCQRAVFVSQPQARQVQARCRALGDRNSAVSG
jgi:hypothetical protein